MAEQTDSGCSSSASTSTACSGGNGGTGGMTIDDMHGLLEEFRAVYESRLQRLDEVEPCEDTQQVVGFFGGRGSLETPAPLVFRDFRHLAGIR